MIIQHKDLFIKILRNYKPGFRGWVSVVEGKLYLKIGDKYG